jgi:hypothetical protein
MSRQYFIHKHLTNIKTFLFYNFGEYILAGELRSAVDRETQHPPEFMDFTPAVQSPREVC